MQRARMFLFLGIWVAILPYLGFPYSWKDALSTLTGAVIIIISYSWYKESRAKEIPEEKFDNFSENKDFATKEEAAETRTRISRI